MATWHHGVLQAPGGGPASPGKLSSHVAVFEGTQHVFYGAPDGFVYEFWWRGTGAHPGKLAPGGALLTSHVNEALHSQHVFYLTGDHIWEISWVGTGSVNRGDLMPAGDPKLRALTAPKSHALKSDSSNHVFYGTLTGHVAELSWRGDEVPRQRDLLLAQNGVAPTTASAPVSHVFEGENSQHVFYLAGGHIIELAWTGADGQPVWRDLHATATAPAPAAISVPATHVFEDERTQHVFYLADTGDIIEFWWGPGEAPHPENLTKGSGAPALSVPFGPLLSHVFQAEGTQHVFFVDNNGHIREIWWARGGSKGLEDITSRSIALPLSPGTSIVNHVVESERTQHLFYPAREGDHTVLTEIWSQP